MCLEFLWAIVARIDLGVRVCLKRVNYFSSIRAALFGGRQSVTGLGRLRERPNLENAVNFVLSSRDGYPTCTA